MATAISALVTGGLIYGYVQSSIQSEWSCYSLAAQSLAQQRMEETRSAAWDPTAFPPLDQLLGSNFPVTTNVMDIPLTGTNTIYCTNTTTITDISTTPRLRCVRVDCTWKFMSRPNIYTNTVVTYRCPDTY